MVNQQNEALRLAYELETATAFVGKDGIITLKMGTNIADQAAEELRRLHAEVNRLRTIIDSRPAINAGLPATYIEWSHSIYEMDMAHAIANLSGGFQ